MEGRGVDLERELEKGERGDKDVVDLPKHQSFHRSTCFHLDVN